MAGAAAAATVVVRRARNEQAPARLEMDRLVLRSERSLNISQVCVFDIEVSSASLHTSVASRKSLKVKLHTAGEHTLLKWKSSKVDVRGNGDASAVFDARGGFVFEGGSSLTLDLCAPRLMRKSLVLGRGQLPLQLIVGQVELNSPIGRTWQVDLFDVSNQETVLASLGISIRMAITKLEEVGGFGTLRLLQVPERPTLDDSVFTFKEEVERCRAYCSRVLAVKQELLEVFKGVTRGIFLARAGARGGTETPATTAGSEMPELQDDDFSIAEFSVLDEPAGSAVQNR